MNKTGYMTDRIRAALGEEKPDLVLKNANIINVFTESTQKADIAVKDGYIVGIGEYSAKEEVDLSGKYVCSGFIDGHIHLESTLVMPSEFEKAVLPHGTTAVIADPHEIANVAGTEGIDFIMDATKALNMDVFFMIPSCVPATSLDESGAFLTAEKIRPYYDNPRVLGLAEFMDAHGVLNCSSICLDKLCSAKEEAMIIDGHAPLLTGKPLNAYVVSGVNSDHECSNMSEALEKLSLGQWIMIREGTAAKNLCDLIGLFETPYHNRCLLVTDDKHTSDLLNKGHIDDIIRLAIKAGADPIKAIKMGSYNAALYFKLVNRGAVAPGYIADLVVIDSLSDMNVSAVYKKGKLRALNGRPIEYEANQTDGIDKSKYPSVYHSFNMARITPQQLKFDISGTHQRVIELVDGQLTTSERIATYKEIPGYAPGVDINNDIVKLAAFERHNGTGHIGLGFLGNYGLKKGAVATSIGHDSHNLLVAGVTDEDIAAAGNRVIENNGGLAISCDGKIIAELPLPIGGLISELPVNETAESVECMKVILRDMGISENIDPFMTLAFVSLPVIPKLRLNPKGLIDVENQILIPSIF